MTIYQTINISMFLKGSIYVYIQYMYNLLIDEQLFKIEKKKFYFKLDSKHSKYNTNDIIK